MGSEVDRLFHAATSRRFYPGFIVGCLLVGLVIGCGREEPSRAVEPAAAAASSVAAPVGRVLFIGIDGCRFDALEKARTPHLDRLRAAGCYADDTLIQGDRYRGSDTVSGPGWSSLLTGVWADKHGVDSNRFERMYYDKYPMYFRRVKQAYPEVDTAAFSSWPPISKQIISDADINLRTSTDHFYTKGDREAAEATVDLLRHGNPMAVFTYFGQVDEHGHKFEFSPERAEYMAAIERVDALIGTVIDALERRPNYAAENWLVLVSTDHGGLGTDHANGRTTPEIMRSFLIVSGAAAERGKLKDQTYIVDVLVTALAHLGVKLDPSWGLDGKSVGLKRK